MTRLLLDTHALVWWVLDSTQLPPSLIGAVEAADEVAVSPLSLWEIVIKQSTGRPILGIADPSRWFSQAMSASGFSLLTIELGHIAAVHDLPMLHRDPFDRLLVAQASVEGLTLVSRDRQLAKYPVSVIWGDHD